MKSKFSRAAVAAGVVMGTYGLVAASADAADTLYFVSPPAVASATQVTPESATVNGIVETGGNPGGTFTLAGGAGLAWGDGLDATNTGSTAETFSVDGLPVSGSSSNVLISGGTPSTVSNDGADNFSDVEFAYDTLADYTRSGDAPGPDTQYSTEVDVPTTGGLSKVSASIGAFGQAAQDNTGNTPLSPNTTYVYWLSDQPGATDDAESINTFNPKASNASTSVNPSYQCLPDSYIAANSYLSTLTSGSMVAGGVSAPGGPAQTAPQAAIQGPCVYFFGNVSGADTYNSPVGKFTTPKIGKLSIGSVATVKGHNATVKITDASAYKASGTIQLVNSDGDVLANARFNLAAKKTGVLNLKLTGVGVKAAKKDQKGKITLTSNWDQPTSTKSIKL